MERIASEVLSSVALPIELLSPLEQPGFDPGAYCTGLHRSNPLDYCLSIHGAAALGALSRKSYDGAVRTPIRQTVQERMPQLRPGSMARAGEAGQRRHDVPLPMHVEPSATGGREMSMVLLLGPGAVRELPLVKRIM
jgi:hypothetical protein